MHPQGIERALASILVLLMAATVAGVTSLLLGMLGVCVAAERHFSGGREAPARRRGSNSMWKRLCVVGIAVVSLACASSKVWTKRGGWVVS